MPLSRRLVIGGGVATLATTPQVLAMETRGNSRVLVGGWLHFFEGDYGLVTLDQPTTNCMVVVKSRHFVGGRSLVRPGSYVILDGERLPGAVLRVNRVAALFEDHRLGLICEEGELFAGSELSLHFTSPTRKFFHARTRHIYRAGYRNLSVGSKVAIEHVSTGHGLAATRILPTEPGLPEAYNNRTHGVRLTTLSLYLGGVGH